MVGLIWKVACWHKLKSDKENSAQISELKKRDKKQTLVKQQTSWRPVRLEGSKSKGVCGVCVCACACVCVSVCVQARAVMSDFCNPMDHSPPGSPMHGISQAKILEWVVIFASKGSSQSRDQSRVS